VLQGKDKPTFLPSADGGDVCVVVNADKAVLTGRKWDGKLYRWHTGARGSWM
jgi:large subunit ribosomal protein L13